MSTHDCNSFKPIENPYIVGNPVKEPKMFFGREEDFAFIRQKVSGASKGGLLVLCGARRSGKTSILFQIMNGRLGDEFFPVLIDMQSMTVKGDREFLVKLAERIVEATGVTEIPADTFFDKTPDNSLDAFQSFVLGVIRGLAGKKLLILFDEYEIFEARIDKGDLSPAILDVFGSWLDHQDDIFIVFTGSEKVDERKRDYWGRFLPKAVYSKRISFLSQDDTFRLIKKPLENTIRYEHGVPEKIYALTAGQPFYTQVFCQVLVDNLNERKEYDVSSADLDAAVDQIVDNPLPQMIFSWNSLSDAERLTLAIMAELGRESIVSIRSDDIGRFIKEKQIGVHIDHTVLNESLERLFHQDILEKDPSGESYSFKMGLWKKWIARMHSVWEITDEMKDSEDVLGEGISLPRGRRRRGRLVIAVSLTILAIAVAVVAYLQGREKAEPVAAPPPTPDSTRVTIRTSPPGAEIILGGRILGMSPIDDQLVPVEVAVLEVRLAGYKDFVDTLDLSHADQTKQTIALVEQTGGLRLTSSPPGADVSVNGQPRPQKTPVLVEDLPIDELYDIQMTLTGHEPGEYDNIQVFEDSVVSKNHIFKILEFQVRITSTPDAGDVYIDDRFAGKTPNTAVVAYGEHKIEVKKQRYETVTLDRRVPQDGNEFDIVLEKLAPGVLVVMVRPWADIYIDGDLAERERTNYRMTLDPGTYVIRLLNPHFEPKETEIEVRPNEESVFEWDLKAKEQQ